MDTKPVNPPKLLAIDGPDRLPIEPLRVDHEATQDEQCIVTRSSSLESDTTSQYSSSEADAASQFSSPEPEQVDQKEALPLIISHAAMSQAMNVSEITYLIRQELRGVDLKGCALVHSSWWKCFAPYLWERVFIDSDPGKSDRAVIFRNGLAARSLTLSIYDDDVLQAMEAGDTKHEHYQGSISYVAERCRNVATLNLKLFSSRLVIKKETLDLNPTQDQDADEYQTPVLDALFQKLPHVTDLTLSIVHEDLDQNLVNSVRHLPQLRNLTLLGGLRGSASYIVKKNRRCHWPSLARILQRSCPLLESLSVAWESPTSTVAESAPQEPEQERRQESLLTRLRTFDMSHCCFQDEHQLDNLFWSSPNLRRLTLDTVSDPNAVLDRQLFTLVKACPRLLSFQCLRPVLSDTPVGSNLGFLKWSNIQALSDLVLSVHSLSNGLLWELIIRRDGATDLDTYYCALPAIKTIEPSSLTMTITSLTLNDISEMSPVWAALQAFSRLERLTLEGEGKWQSQWPYSDDNEATKVTNALGMPDHKLRLLEFETSMAPACAETLQRLDISKLEFHNDEAFRLFMKIVVQRMKRLNHLHLSTDHIRRAYLKQTWSKEHPSEKGKLRKKPSGNVEDILREKAFVHFGAVEFLYLYIIDYAMKTTSGRLSKHELSALTRAMPKLRVLAHDRRIHIKHFPPEEFVWMTIMPMEPLKLALA